jgi:NACalpha-BTF3-like transcription factor
MISFSTTKRTLLLAFALLMSSPTIAQSDVWHDLLSALKFADVNRARLEFDCNQNPLYRTKDMLVALCKKRYELPNHVYEEAALPYLKKHLTESMAKQALAQVSGNTWQSLSRKLRTEIRTGKHDQLTQEDIDLLEKQNQSEVGRALSTFASDKEQGIAVARAILTY